MQMKQRHHHFLLHTFFFLLQHGAYITHTATGPATGYSETLGVLYSWWLTQPWAAADSEMMRTRPQRGQASLSNSYHQFFDFWFSNRKQTLTQMTSLCLAPFGATKFFMLFFSCMQQLSFKQCVKLFIVTIMCKIRKILHKMGTIHLYLWEITSISVTSAGAEFRVFLGIANLQWYSWY